MNNLEKKNGKFVYKNQECMEKINKFYDKALDSLHVSYEEMYINTSYGKTHILILGDKKKTPIFTVHGGNGISPLNIKIFLPLLEHYCIISPDVIGMPGKSEPYRNLNSSDDYGLWLCEVLDIMKIEKINFVVSSYSSAMMLSLAKVSPERIDKAALVVPSGFSHGSIIPIIKNAFIPFTKYYFFQSEKSLNKIMNVMASDDDAIWKEFFNLMMSSYKMELRPPKEFKKKELDGFNSPVIIFASNEDIFFPADKVFSKAKEILNVEPQMFLIEGLHLPSNSSMSYICSKIHDFFEEKIDN